MGSTGQTPPGIIERTTCWEILPNRFRRALPLCNESAGEPYVAMYVSKSPKLLLPLSSYSASVIRAMLDCCAGEGTNQFICLDNWDNKKSV